MWTVYTHTPVGQVFAREIAPTLVRQVDQLLGYDPWPLAFQLVIGALSACLAVGAVSSFLLLKR